ncbi:MAG: hypothetical protein VR68_09225 [Peptococcaceae bacterium BRH_c4a]|nr:MAG: hypothetical protein VR68_09225 [Peptococcaceae bacterium BRH_c4a]
MAGGNIKNIVLAHNNMNSLPDSGKFDLTYKWLYLGSNYINLVKWEKKLKWLERLYFSEELNKKAWELREPFIKWISGLGKDYGNSLVWWATNISEKNTMSSDLFLNLCYLGICKDILDTEQNIIIICEEWHVYIAVHKLLEKSGKPFSKFAGWHYIFIKSMIKEVLVFSGRWGYHLISLLKYHFMAGLSRKESLPLPLNPDQPTVIIHSCIDQKSFKRDRVFDRFFTILPEWLEERGYNVIRLAWLYNINRNLLPLYRILRKSNAYIIPQDYISIADFPRAILTVLKGLNVPDRNVDFRGLDVSSLILKEQFLQSAAGGMVKFLMYFNMITRWKKAGLKCDFFIDKFENMGLEKPQILALREFYPETEIIGYQHSTISPFMLKFSTTREEIERGIFPDRIVSNGHFFRDILIKNGFPQEMVVSGPALRYTHIFNKNFTGKGTAAKKKILVLLTLEVSSSVELVHKTLRWLGGTPWTVLLKPHPMMPMGKLLDSLGIGKLPANFEWAEGEIEECLHLSSCAIGTAGAALFDAIGAGVPLIVLARETTLTINPMGWLEKELRDIIPVVYTGEQLISALKNLTTEDSKVIREMVAKAKEAIVDCFNPVRDEFLEMFVQPEISRLPDVDR